MADIASLIKALKDTAVAQYGKGAPYREALASALKGDMSGVNQALSQSELTPADFAGFVGGIKDVSLPYQNMGLKFDVHEYPNKNEIYLSRIEVPKEQRGQGIGTQAMQDLINYANEKQQRITLTPSTDFGATSVNRLKDFYKNLGFVENKGSNKDFSTRETMYKTPEN
jgi:predicted GNAT family acetyltransferase